MRAKGQLHRALARTTLDFHQQVANRRDNTAQDRLAEREQQFQHEFGGAIGTIAGHTEGVLTALFDVVFSGDSGSSRDSSLSYPTCRFGFHMEYGPRGVVPYAYVDDWVYDDDLNFKGAKILVGVHSTTNQEGEFKGHVHSTFQGWGAPVEQYDDGTATAITVG